MTISANSVVSMHYTLTDSEGVQLDSSQGQEPLVYLQGAGNIIPGLEKEMEGKNVGDKFDVTVAPAEAYGEFNEELIQKVPHEAFGEIKDLQPGMQLQGQTPEGQMQMIVVQSVEDDGVVINANHPLAGRELNFAVEVTDIRDASSEEIEHGHPHIPGHEHH